MTHQTDALWPYPLTPARRTLKVQEGRSRPAAGPYSCKADCLSSGQGGCPPALMRRHDHGHDYSGTP